MPITAQPDAGAVPVLELAEILDLNAAAPLVTQFLARRGADLRVDASHVQRLGGQCLQVLLSAAMTWKHDETHLSFVDPSPDFIDGLANLGIAASDLIDQELLG